MRLIHHIVRHRPGFWRKPHRSRTLRAKPRSQPPAHGRGRRMRRRRRSRRSALPRPSSARLPLADTLQPRARPAGDPGRISAASAARTALSVTGQMSHALTERCPVRLAIGTAATGGGRCLAVPPRRRGRAPGQHAFGVARDDVRADASIGAFGLEVVRGWRCRGGAGDRQPRPAIGGWSVLPMGAAADPSHHHGSRMHKEDSDVA
jgi:hypothetical protein